MVSLGTMVRCHHPLFHPREHWDWLPKHAGRMRMPPGMRFDASVLCSLRVVSPTPVCGTHDPKGHKFKEKPAPSEPWGSQASGALPQPPTIQTGKMSQTSSGRRHASHGGATNKQSSGGQCDIRFTSRAESQVPLGPGWIATVDQNNCTKYA